MVLLFRLLERKFLFWIFFIMWILITGNRNLVKKNRKSGWTFRVNGASAQKSLISRASSVCLLLHFLFLLVFVSRFLIVSSLF